MRLLCAGRPQALKTRKAPALPMLLARELGGDLYARQRQCPADILFAWPDVQSSFLATWH